MFDASNLREQMHTRKAVNNVRLVGRVGVMVGSSGVGKSCEINNMLKDATCTIRFVVHEGFQPQQIISKYRTTLGSMSVVANKTVAIQLDVREHADLESLSLFTHHLFSIGILLDDKTGECVALDPVRVRRAG